MDWFENQHIKYALLFLLGIILAALLPHEMLTQSFQFFSLMTATALVASFVMSFAALALTEKWQKSVLQYGLFPVLGGYAYAIWQIGSIVGVVFYLTVVLVHLAYWTSSVHSRQYRFDNFVKGFSFLPKTLMLLAVLRNQGRSQLADEIIQEFSAETKINFMKVEYFVSRSLYEQVQAEYKNFFYDELSGETES